jgi:hypothetical protein
MAPRPEKCLRKSVGACGGVRRWSNLVSVRSSRRRLTKGWSRQLKLSRPLPAQRPRQFHLRLIPGVRRLWSES